MKNKIIARIVLAILFCFVCVPVRAEMITIAISGHVTLVDDSWGFLENKFHSGDVISGTYTYDSSALDSEPLDPAYGLYEYYNAPMGISMNIGEFNFRTNPNDVYFRIGITHLSGTNYYSLFSTNNLPLPNGVEVYEIYWDLIDTTGTALNSDALPTIPPDLSLFKPSITCNFDILGHCSYLIRAEITSATLVPEPATLLLLMFGAAACRRS